MKGKEEDGGLTVEKKNLRMGLQNTSISIQFWQCWAEL
jgi:hypothetical protein